MNKRVRYTSVELIRFIAAVVVMVYHFFTIFIHSNGVIPFAFIVVEFFFIISGFFMMKHLNEKDDPMNPGRYVLHKLKSFYPVFIVAFALQFCLFVIVNKLGDAGAVAGSLWHFKWEASLLQTVAFIPNPQFNADYLLGQAWYLSAMLVSLVIAYPLARYLKKWYLMLICPLVLLISYSYIMQTLGTMNIGNEYFGFISSGVVRGLAGTCAGSLAYAGYAFLKRHPFKNKWLPATVEILCWAALLMLVFVPQLQTDEADALFFVPIFALIVVFAFLNDTPVSKFLNTHATGVLSYLGSFSLYIYMFHWPVMTVLQLWGGGLSAAAATAIFFAATFALAAVFKLVNDRRRSPLPIIIITAVLLAVSFTIPYWGIA